MKHSLSALLFILASQFGHAQTLTYDFSKGAFIKKDLTPNGTVKPVPVNGFAVIKVINVNTFRYKVEIKGESVDYVTQVPSELQTIFRLPNQDENKTNTQEGLAAIQKVPNEISGLLKGIVDIDAVESDPFHALLDKLLSDSKKFSETTAGVVNIKVRRIELINLVKQNWASYEEMKTNIPAPIPARTMQDAFRNFNSLYADITVDATKAKDIATADQKKTVDEILKLVTDGFNKITEDAFLSLIEDVIVLQQALEDENSFTVISPPIQVDGDFIAFNIKATPVKASDLMNFISDKTFPIEIPTKGGWKADFSVGPTVSFGKNAKDEKYYVEEVPNTDSVILRARNNNNAISPGIAAMMHFYPRSGKNVAFGGLFGVGAGFQSVDDVNFSLYAGVSLVMGKRQKIITSAGFSFLRVDRLKEKEFETGKKYAVSKIDLPNVTEKVFKPSFFLSISYNLTNRVEIK